jgi:hypothetical protein
MAVVPIINRLDKIEDKKYLELGIFDGNHFNAVSCERKTSVDRYYPSDYQMTTDDFFGHIPLEEKFDIIYIDACHEYDHVLRDFNNSIMHLANPGLLFVHDLFPPSVEMTVPHYCGDGFKVLYYILTYEEETYERYTLDSDYGLTLFVNPKKTLKPGPFIRDMSYLTFSIRMKKEKLYTTDEMIRLVEERYA